MAGYGITTDQLYVISFFFFYDWPSCKGLQIDPLCITFKQFKMRITLMIMMVGSGFRRKEGRDGGINTKKWTRRLELRTPLWTLIFYCVSHFIK